MTQIFYFLKVPKRSQPAKYGEGFDAPPTLERSGSEHRRAVTSFPLMVKGKAWLGIKDPPAGEGQVGQKTPLWQRRDGVDSLITQTDT